MPGKPAFALMLALLGGPVLASSVGSAVAIPEGRTFSRLNIAPLAVELPAQKRSAIVKVANNGERPATVQLRLYDWRQGPAEDRLEPASALAVSPAIATIAPGKTQLFRLLALAPQEPGESAYRLIVDELPVTGAERGPDVRLRFSVPVFRGATDGVPRLAYRPSQGGLTIANSGASHVRLRDVRLKLADGREIAARGEGPGYVLAGVARQWRWQQALACIPAGARLLVDDGKAGDNVALEATCT